MARELDERLIAAQRSVASSRWDPGHRGLQVAREVSDRDGTILRDQWVPAEVR